MTREQAIKLVDSKFWKLMSHKDIVIFQLFEDRLCMPFTVFHEAIEKTLGRSVFTHEFAKPVLLRKEFLGEREPPSLRDIIELIPEEKRILISP